MTSGDNAPPGPARALRAPDAPLANDGTALSWKRLMPHLAAFTAATVLLAGTFLASRTIEFREKIPIRRPLIQFPLAVGEWRGTALVMEQRFITELDLSDYSIVDYRNSAGAKVDFYVAYYESQRKGESIHSPETCLLGGGWLFADKKTVAVPLGGNPGRVLPVNRVVLEKPGQRLLTYFWFPQRGRVLVNAYQLKIFTFWDALTRQRTDGALVRVMTPIHAAEGSDKADARLADFVRQMVPILDEFLPGRDLG
jgi:EpsI family protein